MKAGDRIKLFFLGLVLSAAATVSAAITINSVQSTQSNCANDGTITINASSSTSMLFAIVAGPDIRPAQNGNQFSGLPIGNYQVMITNFSNDTAIVPAAVTGTYVFPDFAPTFANPICPGSSSGSVFGNLQIGSGRPPYTWQITNTNSGATVTQASDTFSNLPGGDYMIRLSDSCQSFATRYVTLTNPISSFTVSDPVTNDMIACDTNVLSFLIWPVNGYWTPPFYVSVHIGNVIKNDTFNPVLPSTAQVYYFTDTVPGVHLGESGYITVTNACGETVFKSHYIDNWGARVEFYPTTDSCVPKVRAGYTLGSNYYSRTSFTPPITFKVWDVTAGNVLVDSTVQTSNSTYYAPTNYFLQFNHTYSMTVTDGCGHTTTQNFNTPILAPVSVSLNKGADACLDSTTTVEIHCYNYSFATTTLTIISGPPTSHSTKPYFAHNDPLVYPYNVFIKNHCSGYSSNEVCFGVGGLGPGNYRYRVEDSCGHFKEDTFNIEKSDVVSYDFSSKPIRGCPGQSKIQYLIHRSRNYTMQDFMRLYPLGSVNAIDSITSDSATFSNLNPGTYVLEHEINRYHNFDQISPNLACSKIYDTVVVVPYQQPRISYAVQIKCNGTVNVGLQPDSTTGVAPYQYEILSGPEIYPAQSFNFFTFTRPGSYTARISDTCGFARTFTFSVDTLSFQQIAEIGSSCIGNTATLVSQHSPYATYVWTRPNGNKFTGDSLRISPVLATDYGVYRIGKIVNVNNCTDTFYASYTLVSNSRTNLYDTICAGQSAVFAGATYTQTGIYYDTIPTMTCDSIVAFNLLVSGPAYDSVTQIICTGQSITIGTHTYTATGIYRDIFATAGCDSVHILNLTVRSAKTDSVAQSICFGQSVTVGPNTYTATGIYRDTFTTAGCDSIHILNLIVSGAKTDSVVRQICTGQSITIGTHTYTTTGIYRDTFATAGCDSIYILNLTVSGAKTDSVVRQICTGQSITVGTHTYTATGIYRDTFATAGCDSIHILNLTVGGAKKDSVTQSICFGQSITVGANSYTATGIYRDTFPTPGCDSIHILNLTVGGSKTDSVTQRICFGQSVTVGPNIYTATGVYRDTFATAGCDSIHILNLTVGGSKTDSVTQSICFGQSVTVGANTYTTTGIYRDTFATAGCDSIHILHLTVNDIKRDTMVISFCEGESRSVGGHTFTEAGFFTYTIPTTGCDSISNIQVTVFPNPVVHIIAVSTQVFSGDTLHLSAITGSGVSYSWQSGAALSAGNIPNPVATIGQSSWITLLVTDTNQCIAADSIFIAVDDCEASIYVPNVFSPNSDGANDRFQVYGNCIELNTLRIFDRWGEKVWETSDIRQSWDGYYHGELQLPGVYVYYLNYSAAANKGVGKQLKGSLTLMR
jgi:gliding motility-associated-like protein